MSKIEIGRYSEQLRRMFGMAGQDVVSAELAPEISPTIQLEGMSTEWNFLKGVRDVYVGQQISIAVGFVGKWRFRNPITSGVVAVFEYVEMTPQTAAARLAIRVNQQTVDLTTVQPTTVPDTRWGALTASRSALVASFSNDSATAPAGQTIALARTPDSVPWSYPKEILVMPGVTLDAGCEVLNIEMHGTFKWRERAIPVLER